MQSAISDHAVEARSFGVAYAVELGGQRADWIDRVLSVNSWVTGF
jgi:hypothetical protein